MYVKYSLKDLVAKLFTIIHTGVVRTGVEVSIPVACLVLHKFHISVQCNPSKFGSDGPSCTILYSKVAGVRSSEGCNV